MVEKKQEATAGLLTAEDILGSEDLDYVDVEVLEWTPGYKPGGRVVKARKIRLQVMSANQAMGFAAEQKDDAKRRAAMIRLVRDCAVNENGERLFTTDQLDALLKKNFRVFQLLQDHAMVLNGFATEDDDEGGEGND